MMDYEDKEIYRRNAGKQRIVIYSEDGGSCFIIDPGYNGSVFTEYVKEHGLSPKAYC